jgi:hypothetical protein
VQKFHNQNRFCEGSCRNGKDKFRVDPQFEKTTMVKIKKVSNQTPPSSAKTADDYLNSRIPKLVSKIKNLSRINSK